MLCRLFHSRQEMHIIKCTLNLGKRPEVFRKVNFEKHSEVSRKVNFEKRPEVSRKVQA